MKFKKSILQITIAIVLSFSCQSQNLDLTYSDGSISLPLDNGSTTSIDSTTGNVKVTTSDSSIQIGDAIGLQPVGVSPNISFVVIPNGTASADVNATINNEAVYCNKSGLWSGLSTSNPPLTYVSNISETVTSNGTTYTLTCGNSFGVSSNSATVSNITTVLNPVVTISANPMIVNSGGSSLVTWSVTNSPDTCTFSGEWPTGAGTFTPPNFPTNSFTLTNITSSKTLSVICDNSALGDSGLQSITISVAGTGSTWPSCQPPSQSILNNNEDRTIIANGSPVGDNYNGTLNDYFTGTTSSTPLSALIGATYRLALTKNQYIASQFNSGSSNIQARHSYDPPGGSTGPVSVDFTVSISECPGDFTTHLNQPQCISTGTGTNLYWSDNPNADSRFCILQKNTTYYLNMVHATASGVNGYNTSSCGSSYCGILSSIRPVN